MEKELSYLNDEGFTVFTSQFLKNRGTCCKSACLHCPYGYTLKKCGLQFKEVSEKESAVVEEILSENGAAFDWREFLPENIKFISLKEKVIGLTVKNHIIVKNIYLRPHFQSQGISKELVESYLFI